MLVSSRLSTSASCELISSWAVSRAASITSPEFCCRSSLSRLKSPASACRSASRRRTRICRRFIIASLRAISCSTSRRPEPEAWPRSPRASSYLNVPRCQYCVLAGYQPRWPSQTLRAKQPKYSTHPGYHLGRSQTWDRLVRTAATRCHNCSYQAALTAYHTKSGPGFRARLPFRHSPGGHFHSNAWSVTPLRGRQIRHCLPPSDNRQKRTRGCSRFGRRRGNFCRL